MLHATEEGEASLPFFSATLVDAGQRGTVARVARASIQAIDRPRHPISNKPAGEVGVGITGIGGDVLVGVLVGVGEGVIVGVGVLVGVFVGVLVGVFVGVFVGVAVGVFVGVLVGVGGTRTIVSEPVPVAANEGSSVKWDVHRAN